VTEADVLLIEATYGNRLHPKEDVQARLGDIVRRTVQRGGTVLMPAFAVGRAQALLLVLQRLRRAGDIPHSLPIFVDSPMATAATELTLRHRRLLRVSPRELDGLTDGVRFVETGVQSQRLSRSRYPSVIVSASGMATGGRVLHHLQALAPEPRHHLVFPGFQVAGTRGARILAGEPAVKIFGEMVPVRAEVSHLEGFSGHADADELMDWMRQIRRPPRHTFVVHGEPVATDTLRFRIGNELGWAASVPPHGQTVTA
jgi:metallo-beta-lactamase family protein